MAFRIASDTETKCLAGGSMVRKTSFLEPLYFHFFLKRSICQDRLGANAGIGKVEGKTFSAGCYSFIGYNDTTLKYFHDAIRAGAKNASF